MTRKTKSAPRLTPAQVLQQRIEQERVRSWYDGPRERVVPPEFAGSEDLLFSFGMLKALSGRKKGSTIGFNPTPESGLPLGGVEVGPYYMNAYDDRKAGLWTVAQVGYRPVYVHAVPAPDGEVAMRLSHSRGAYRAGPDHDLTPERHDQVIGLLHATNNVYEQQRAYEIAHGVGSFVVPSPRQAA